MTTVSWTRLEPQAQVAACHGIDLCQAPQARQIRTANRASSVAPSARQAKDNMGAAQDSCAAAPPLTPCDQLTAGGGTRLLGD